MATSIREPRLRTIRLRYSISSDNMVSQITATFDVYGMEPVKEVRVVHVVHPNSSMGPQGFDLGKEVEQMMEALKEEIGH